MIITGATAGIGVQTAHALASVCGRVVLAARDSRAEQLVTQIRTGPGWRQRADCEVSWLPLDLSSLASVRAFAERFAAQSSAEGWPPLRLLAARGGYARCAFAAELAP